MKQKKLIGRNYILFDFEDLKLLKIISDNYKKFPFPFNTNSQGVSMAFLSEASNLSKPSFTNHSKKLEILGFIRIIRAPKPYHTSKVISITFEGERVLDIFSQKLLNTKDNSLDLSWANTKIPLTSKQTIEEILEKLRSKV